MLMTCDQVSHIIALVTLRNSGKASRFVLKHHLYLFVYLVIQFEVVVWLVFAGVT